MSLDKNYRTWSNKINTYARGAMGAWLIGDIESLREFSNFIFGR